MGADEISISNVRMAAWSMVCPDAHQGETGRSQTKRRPDSLENLCGLLAGRQWIAAAQTGTAAFAIRGRATAVLDEVYARLDGSLRSDRPLCANTDHSSTVGEGFGSTLIASASPANPRP
jgi:hypothetical protein